jgi:DNA-binding beta-propeller fold protein YncE
VPLPDSANALAISSDGSWLAVASIGASVVTVHPLDAVTGAAAQYIASLSVSQASGAAFTPDGGHIIISSRGDDAVAAYDFDTATGALGTAPATRSFPVSRDPGEIITADVNEDGIVSEASSKFHMSPSAAVVLLHVLQLLICAKGQLSLQNVEHA